jgi:hypothetical protein
MNRFQGINSARLCSLAGRYDNPIPSRFLAPINCLKIQALRTPIMQRVVDGHRTDHLCTSCFFKVTQ